MNQPFRFLHSSDFHLERPPRGLAEVPEHLRTAFADAPYRAAERVFDAAIAERVDFVVLSGDLADPLATGPRAVVFLSEQFARMADKGIKVYWAGGRSDNLQRWIDEWPLPESVVRFPVHRVQRIIHLRGGEPLAEIMGTSAQQRKKIRTSDFRTDHGELFTLAVAYGSAEMELLSQEGVQYWALGGEHCRRAVLTAPITAHYPGSPQGRRPQESGPHGCTLVHVDETRRIRTGFIPADAIRFLTQRIAASDAQTSDQLHQIISERVADLVNDPFGPDLLVTWKIVGRSPLGDQLRRGRLAVDLTARLRTEHGQRRPALWTVAVESELAEEVDVTSDQTLLGEFLRTVRHYLEHSEEPLNLEPYLSGRHVADNVASAVLIDEPDVRRLVLAEVARLGTELLSPEETRS